MILSVNKVNHWFGNKKVLYDVNLKVARGQFIALVGPSGCGKSTLLKAILGTHLPQMGKIFAEEREVKGPTRHVGIVYQHYSLYPFLTVEENVALGPKLDQTSVPYRLSRPFAWNKLRKEHLNEARNLLEEFGLGFCIKQYPRMLSGGQRQRVAIAQALIMKPSILLLDEPFGALDEATREDLQEMLLKLYQVNIEAKNKGEDAPYTCIFVTHQLNEAFYVADRVVGLSQYWQHLKEDELMVGCGNEGYGATVIFDKAAPVYSPTDFRDFNRFLELKNLLRETVFNESTKQELHKHVTYWSEIASVQGV